MISIMVISILIFGDASEQGLRGIRNCEEGEVCMEKNDCPEYLKFLSLTGQSKRIEGQRLRGNICNKKPDKLCCKVKTLTTVTTTTTTATTRETSGGGECEEGEICLDKNKCPEYFKYKSLTGKSKTIEGKRLSGKICNKKPDKLCCIKELTISTPKTNARTKQNSPQICRQKGQSYSKSFLPAADQCGVSCSGTKSVVHGKDASLGEFPWAALLGSQKIKEHWDNRRKKWVNQGEKLYHCGGTLINTWFVLTAAHCHTREKKIVEVVLGEWDVLTDPDCPIDEEGCNNPRVQRKEVEDVIVHGGYFNKTGPNDIAIIKLTTEVKLNTFVQLGCLPLPEYKFQFHNPEFRDATVVGWGRSSNEFLTKEDLIYYGLSENKLQKGNLLIRSMSECRKTNPTKEIHSSQLCASGEAGTGTSSCHGDSGGGLFIHSNHYPGQSQGNVHVQVGVVSYGERLCGDSPGIYTRVDQFIPWIRENIRT